MLFCILVLKNINTDTDKCVMMKMMMMMIIIIIIGHLLRHKYQLWVIFCFTSATAMLGTAWADLPDGCEPLNEYPFSTVDPTDFYEANSELASLIPPQRMGDWADDLAIPTQHFVINQIKPNGPSAVRLIPYSGTKWATLTPALKTICL